MFRCPNCSLEQPQGMRFCATCGYEFDDDPLARRVMGQWSQQYAVDPASAPQLPPFQSAEAFPASQQPYQSQYQELYQEQQRFSSAPKAEVSSIRDQIQPEQRQPAREHSPTASTGISPIPPSASSFPDAPYQSSPQSSAGSEHTLDTIENTSALLPEALRPVRTNTPPPGSDSSLSGLSPRAGQAQAIKPTPVFPLPGKSQPFLSSSMAGIAQSQKSSAGEAQENQLSLKQRYIADQQTRHAPAYSSAPISSAEPVLSTNHASRVNHTHEPQPGFMAPTPSAPINDEPYFQARFTRSMRAVRGVISQPKRQKGRNPFLTRSFLIIMLALCTIVVVGGSIGLFFLLNHQR